MLGRHFLICFSQTLSFSIFTGFSTEGLFPSQRLLLQIVVSEFLMDSCEFSMESQERGEISGSFCSSNKYKLLSHNKFKSFSEFCCLVCRHKNRRNFLALCVDMRRGYGCLSSAYFSYLTYLPPPALNVLTGRTE